MPASEAPPVPPILIVGFAVLVLAGIAVQFAAPPAKRRMFSLAIGLAGAAIFLAIAYVTGGLRTLLWVGPSLALILFLNFKTVRYCRQCGAFNRNPFIVPVPRFCNRCGAGLDAPTRTTD